jgi:hypothetical protein
MSRFREQKIIAWKCWKVEKYISKVRKKNLRRKLQLFSTTESLALRSKTKISNHNLQFCSYDNLWYDVCGARSGPANLVIFAIFEWKNLFFFFVKKKVRKNVEKTPQKTNTIFWNEKTCQICKVPDETVKRRTICTCI